MEWEDKFSAIVRETESNLARVKQRLGSARTSSMTALNHNSSYKDPLYDSLPSSFVSQDYNNPLTRSQLDKTPDKRSQFDTALDSNRYEGALQTLPLAESPGVLNLLQDKLESQSKIIESLSKSVGRLEKEKDFYYKQVKDLRDEISILNSRIQERGVDMNTERKVDSWKRDMMSEVSMLQTQLSMYKTNQDDASRGTSQMAALIRETQDLKRYLENEMNLIRREMNNMKSRVVRIEMETSALTTDQKDLTRRHDKIERAVQDLRDNQAMATRDISRSMGDQDHSKLEVTEMKSSLRNLRDKISDLENQVYSDSLIYKQNIAKKKPSKKTKTKPMIDKALSDCTPSVATTTDLDLDLSDSTDLDFLSPRSKVIDDLETPRFDGDDLDLDDLDLIDDLSSSAGTMTAEDL